jgi:hypothetical protein
MRFRRIAVVGASFAACLLAVSASGAEGGGNIATSDPALESVLLTVLLTVVGFATLGAIAYLVSLVRRRANQGGGDERPETWVERAIALATFLATLAGLAFLLRHGLHRIVARPAARVGAVPVGAHATASKLPLSSSAAISTGVVILLLVAVVVARRHWRFGRIRRPFHAISVAAPVTPDVAPATETPVSVPATGSELGDPALERDPRRAIELAYARFHGAMEGRGLTQRRWSETADEYLARVEQERLGSGAAARKLTGLFARVRYSTATVGERERDEALAALAAVTGPRRGQPA